jgi:hypothetical protein
MVAGRLASDPVPPKAHCQLDDLQCVQAFECGGLAADNVERERGARAGALTREDTAGGGGLFEVSKGIFPPWCGRAGKALVTTR